MRNDQQNMLKILKSWHVIEFFQPYSIPTKENFEEEMLSITINELHSKNNSVLPWLDINCRHQLNINSKKIRYTLYLGLFDKSLLSYISDQKLGVEGDENGRIETEQRLDSEGMTCFAKLSLDEYGVPDFEGMSVSTLPWALGHLITGTERDLTLQNYDSRCAMLKEQLGRIQQKLRPHPEEPLKNTLCSDALDAILTSLSNWAQFWPARDFTHQSQSQFAFAVDWKEFKEKQIKLDDKTKVLVDDSEIEEDDNDDVVTDDGRVMPILNSFYINDIEKAIRSISSGTCNRALTNYLSINFEKHSDLHCQDGLKLIIERLAPKYTSAGRWPSEPAHNMSLMQQFSVNTAIFELKNGGILSVNGPPGTGKTTLLRDIIAHNVVQRAKVIAGLVKASDGLDESGYLIPELTGFEMVVASSNNAAVENISRELPQIKSLGEMFKSIDYLKPIANQLNAESRKGKLQPIKSEKKQCWGAISAVMGRKINRSNFIQRFLFENFYDKDSLEETVRSNDANFLSFWRWKALHKGIDFTKAKTLFNQKINEFNIYNNRLETISELAKFLNETSLEMFLKEPFEIKMDAEDKFNFSQETLLELNAKLSVLNEMAEIEDIRLNEVYNHRPSLFRRVFNHGVYANYKNKISEINKSRIKFKENRLCLIKEINAIKSDCILYRNQLDIAIENLNNNEKKYKSMQRELNDFYQDNPEKNIPNDKIKINDPVLQRKAYWQDTEINQLRSEIFIAAMELHQAWIYDAISQKCFRQNILFKLSEALSGKSCTNANKMWQILFMIVPVLSTTFASLGLMFRDISSDTLGWLMIDEAGQAVPQSAVGGLLRCKRALVVGDPLQIEPVFTTPPKLVKYLSDQVLGNDGEKWNPSLWSVQKIADRVNPYGCELPVMNLPIWIGIPLWVHRRCIEPMFSLANKIAYDNRMIHANDFELIEAIPHSVLGDNSWLISKGECTVKQYKSELGIDTLNLLFELAEKNNSLSDIYVITPFKAVKNQLHREIDIHKNKIIQLMNWSIFEYKLWCKNNIGTVHTFQGKENDTVVLVLGCDPKKEGGAVWASSKPNLLNVALTRAKKNFYVIGDPIVWQNKEYFNSVASKLLK